MKERAFSIIVVFIALAIAGCALVPLLPVKLAPSQTLPSITVRYSMQGASARTVEQEVTSRIESVIARMQGVKEIDSKSRNGGGRVTVSLDRHADVDNARFEVSAIIRQIWGELPENVSYPTISLRQADKEGSRPFMTLTLNAPANPADILAYGEDNMKPALAKTKGVGKVELSGAQPMEWKLRYDIDRLDALGITPDDIRQAITEHYHSEFLGIAPISGDSDGHRMRLTLRPPAGSRERFAPEEIVLTTRHGDPITLDKITETTYDESDPTGYFRVNGLNSIYVNITAEENANQLNAAKAIRNTLETLERRMPPGYTTDTVYDATEEINDELDKIYFRTGLTVAILLLFVALVSMSLRYMMMITAGLTINLAVAAGFYYLTDTEIQLYSLAGITISLNLIIDNLIVMADHYTRRRNAGAFTSIMAATLTTAGALSVVFFMDEKTRLSLQDFVTVVIINLAVSLAVALLLVPALIERMGIRRSARGGRSRRLRRKAALALSGAYDKAIGLAIRFRGAIIAAVVLAFGLPVFMIPEKTEGDGLWAEKYNAIFGSDTYKEQVKPWTDRILGGTLRLFVEKVYNGSYLDREPGEPVLMINATLPNGATLEQMNTLMKKMEAYLAEYPEIRQFQTSITSPRRASISVFFEREHRHDGFPYRLKSDVISKAITTGGGSWSVYGLEDMGFSNDVRETAGSYRVRMIGYNYDELYRQAERMRDTLLTHRRIREVDIASEFSYWKDDYSEFHLAIDREKLAKAGLDAGRLFSAIEPTFGRGTGSGSIASARGNEMIRLYSTQGDRYDLFALMRQPFTADGKTFKLADICSIEKRQAPQEIVKKNQEYVLCLQYEYIGSTTQGERLLRQDIETINSTMPAGYRAENINDSRRPEDDRAKYLLILLVTGIIFVITSILFNSLRQPLAIIFIIPVSFIGVFSIFHLMRLNFDQGGFASFILLAGITVNAAIYILDEYNTLRRQYPKATPRKVYIRAFRIKIVPILLTVTSTILGFIPFIAGTTRESFWYPLAIGTMGGLAMSLAGLLAVFPVLVLPKAKAGKRNPDRRKKEVTPWSRR